MARRDNLTKSMINGLEPEAKRFEIRDTRTRGLILIVTPKGTKTFYLSKWVNGRSERIKIGRWPEITVKQARDRAVVLQGEIAAGRNPAERKRAARAEMTLGELWKLYLDRHAKPYKKSWETDRYQYEKHLKRWDRRKLSDIGRGDVAAIHRRITRNGGPTAANRIRALLSSMYSKAIEWGAEVLNPCVGIKPHKEEPRTRYLLDDELRRFIHAVEMDKNKNARDAFRLLLFTGQRKSNVLGMRWEHLDFRDRVWRIPAVLQKSGRPHVVSLAAGAISILLSRDQSGEFVFSKTNVRGYWYDIRKSWTRVLRSASIQDLKPHDLRRTFATKMLSTGVGSDVVGRALGHAPTGVTASVYAFVELGAVRKAVESTVERMLLTTNPSPQDRGLQRSKTAFPEDQQRIGPRISHRPDRRIGSVIRSLVSSDPP